MDGTCLRWEDNIQFWQKLHAVIDAEPSSKSSCPMYGLLAALGIEKGKPFAPDARMKGILETRRQGWARPDAGVGVRQQPARPHGLARSQMGMGRPRARAARSSKRRRGIDLEARDRWFAQAIVTSPAMFRRDAGAGSLYWLGLRDATGAYLDGGKTYKLTVPLPVPGKLFWSVTVYDAADAQRDRRPTRTRPRCARCSS